MKRKIFSLISILSIIISVYVVYPNNVNADSEIISSGKISGDFEMRIEAGKTAMWLNGKLVETDVPTQVINNDFMMPMRAAFESIGAYVDFNSEAKTVTVTYEDDTLILNLDSNAAILNDKRITISSPVLLVNDRALVPVKSVMSILGFDIITDESNTVLTITYSSDYSYSISSNGVLEISGNGKIPKFNYSSNYPWDAHKDIITEINVSEGITHIPDNMFADCTNAETLFLPASIKYIGRNITSNSLMDVYYNDSHLNWDSVNNLTDFEQYALMHFTDGYIKYAPESDFVFVNGAITKYKGTGGVVCVPPKINGLQVSIIADGVFEAHGGINQIIIPSGIIIIGEQAFYGSPAKRIIIPNTVKTIGEQAFYWCADIKNLVIPDEITALGDYSFWHCYCLENIELPCSITEIGRYAFSECRSLKNLIIPESAFNIKSYAFHNCIELKNIILPSSITTIANNAFEGCSALTSIELPSIQCISSETFKNNYNLNSVYIPTTVKSIDSAAFYGCYSLTDIFYSGSEDDWNCIDIAENNELLYNATIHYNSYDTDNYIIYYYSNGGETSVCAESYPINTSALITDNIPTRNGYKFIGWSTSKYATSPEYNSGDEYTSNESISLYAIWEAVPQIINSLQEYSDYTIATVSVDKLKEPCTLCVAQYIDDILLKTETRSYNDGSELFLISDNADKLKIMAWDDLNNIVPVCKSRTVYIDNNKNSADEETITKVKLNLAAPKNGTISAEYINELGETITI